MNILDLRRYLNISETDDSLDYKIESLYALSKKLFTHYTRVVVDQTSFTQTEIGFSGNIIYLDACPFVEMIAVNSYSAFNGSGTTITNYQVLDNVVYFSTDLSCTYLTIEYTVGYASIPAELDQVLV